LAGDKSSYANLLNFQPVPDPTKTNTVITWPNDRVGDPFFAFTIGVSAAFLRICRDQREKFPEKAQEIGYGEVMQMGGRRLRRWWAGILGDYER
ncbi:hypothetical protein AARAC_008203, partial [Aspergillus arachidicola]